MHPLIAALLGFLASVTVNLLADYLPMRRYLLEARRNPFTNQAALPPMPSFFPQAPIWLWSGLISLLLGRKTFDPPRTVRRLIVEIWLPILYAYCAANLNWNLFFFLAHGTILTFIVVTDIEWRQIFLESVALLAALVFINALMLNTVPLALAGGLISLLYGGALWVLGIVFGLFVRVWRGRGVTRTIFGLGDVWLLGACGMFLGPDSLPGSIILTIISAGFASLLLIVNRARLPRHKRRTLAIPYAPYIAFGAMIMLYVPHVAVTVFYTIGS